MLTPPNSRVCVCNGEIRGKTVILKPQASGLMIPVPVICFRHVGLAKEELKCDLVQESERQVLVEHLRWALMPLPTYRALENAPHRVVYYQRRSLPGPNGLSATSLHIWRLGFNSRCIYVWREDSPGE
jgi:hypothetical protein